MTGEIIDRIVPRGLQKVLDRLAAQCGEAKSTDVYFARSGRAVFAQTKFRDGSIGSFINEAGKWSKVSHI